MALPAPSFRIEFFLDFPDISRKFPSAPILFPENEEIPGPPPGGFLIGIYKFYENWSTETFRKVKEAGCLLQTVRIYSSAMPSSAILHSENVNLEDQTIVIKYLFFACLLRSYSNFRKKGGSPPSSTCSGHGFDFFFESAFEHVLCHIQFVVHL